jgi:hypothetical protein
MPASPGQVPHTQALLQAALAASWQRDRRVVRRRLALRWLVWGLWRCVALVLLLALAWAAWRWLMPEIHLQQTALSQDRPVAQHASARSMLPAGHVELGTTAPLQDPPTKPENRLHSKEH